MKAKTIDGPQRGRPTFFERSAPAILLVTLAAAPLLAYSALRTVRSNSNKVADWLPASFHETADLRWFRQHFATDQFVVISWEGCRLGDPPGTPHPQEDDPRIERLAQAIMAKNPAGEGKGADSGYFHSVITGRWLLDQLTSPPMGVPYDQAIERLKGSVIGPDGRQTCVVVVLTDRAVGELRKAIGRGSSGALRLQRAEGELFQAIRASGLDPQEVYLGGPPVDNAAIDAEGERTLLRLAGLAAGVGLLLAWWSLRSVRLTAIVFACGVLSAVTGLAVVWLTGETSDAILLAMPSLVYVLAMSGAVHLINYYGAAVAESGLRGAPERAIARGARPALLCSVTTAMGLLSLYTSDLTPIRKFGLYSAVGVLLTLVILFVFLPAALQMWPARPKDRDKRLASRSARNSTGAEGRRPLRLGRRDFWRTLGAGIIHHHRWVALASLALIVGLSAGVGRVRTSIDLLKLFDQDARILKDYRWLEAHVGHLVPMEIVLRFSESSLEGSGGESGNGAGLRLVDRLELVSKVQQAIVQEFGPGGNGLVENPLSAISFVPSLPAQRRGTSGVIRRSVTNSRLERAYDDLSQSGYLCRDEKDGAELWRISLRVAAFQGVDYGRFSDKLRHLVDPLIAQANARIAQRIEPSDKHALSAVYTGVVPIVYKAQRALLESLIESTVWSFLTITPLLMFVSRGVRAGVVTMLPNVLPVLVVFGGMGWLGLTVDIGSMMSASIALGVAVDDTIHFLSWFRHSLDHAQDRHSAILSAYGHCATPTLQGALINGLGLSVFSLSTFTPTQQFGYLMLTILIAGVIAELILLPALLAGPLGRVFRPSAATSWWEASRAQIARARHRVTLGETSNR